MVMAQIYTALLFISCLCAVATGSGSALAAAVPQGAQSGITLGISLAGSLCLWTGVGRLLEHSGISSLLSRAAAPLLRRLFPSTRQDKRLAGALSGNIIANFLGLGNAATPLGIRAARLMAEGRQGVASDELCRLIVLNTASIQLIPANVAAIRAGLGSTAPFDILPAVWVTSLCSASLGLAAAWLFSKVGSHD